jgi:hypothetical protein
MYIPFGEKEPFPVDFALDLEEWKKSVRGFRLKCKCKTFYVPQLNNYYNFEADFITQDNKQMLKFNINLVKFELFLEEDDWDSIYEFFIHPGDEQNFIDHCVIMIKHHNHGIWFGTGAEECRPIDSYYDVFLNILFSDFSFDQYNLNAFCSDFLSHFGSFYKCIGVRKAECEKGIEPGPHVLQFPAVPSFSSCIP